MPRRKCERVPQKGPARTFESILAAACVDNTERLALRANRPAVSDADTRARSGVGSAEGGRTPATDVTGWRPRDVRQTLGAADAARAGKEKRFVKLSELWFHAEVWGD